MSWTSWAKFSIGELAARGGHFYTENWKPNFIDPNRVIYFMMVKASLKYAKEKNATHQFYAHDSLGFVYMYVSLYDSGKFSAQ